MSKKGNKKPGPVTVLKSGMSLRMACKEVVRYLEPYIIMPGRDYEFVKINPENGEVETNEDGTPKKYKKKGGMLTNEEIDIVLQVWSDFANMNALKKPPYISMTRDANYKSMMKAEKEAEAGNGSKSL